MIYTQSVTRAVVTTSGQFLNLGQGVDAFVIVGDSLRRIKFVRERGIPLIFYEVSNAEDGSGSWWLPVSSVIDAPINDISNVEQMSLWGDWEPLQASGNIVTTNLLRPKAGWCWMPAGTLEQSLTPVEFAGIVFGPHPTFDPGNQNLFPINGEAMS